MERVQEISVAVTVGVVGLVLTSALEVVAVPGVERHRVRNQQRPLEERFNESKSDDKERPLRNVITI